MFACAPRTPHTSEEIVTVDGTPITILGVLPRGMLPRKADMFFTTGALAHDAPSIEALAESTRIARNGRIVMRTQPLSEGDELALLPPVGGG